MRELTDENERLREENLDLKYRLDTKDRQDNRLESKIKALERVINIGSTPYPKENRKPSVEIDVSEIAWKYKLQIKLLENKFRSKQKNMNKNSRLKSVIGPKILKPFKRPHTKPINVLCRLQPQAAQKYRICHRCPRQHPRRECYRPRPPTTTTCNNSKTIACNRQSDISLQGTACPLRIDVHSVDPNQLTCGSITNRPIQSKLVKIRFWEGWG
jgi:hypothetical protein